MTASAEPAAAAPTPQKRFPDFFIVGHPKCGTTALYEMLKSHPQIYMPELKEPRFFATDLSPHTPRHEKGPTPNTVEQYLALFVDAKPEQRVGEASPLYLVSRTAAGMIAEVQRDARIIAILREPASFLRSLHLQYVQSYAEPEKDLRKAISLEQARREDKPKPGRASRWRRLLYSEHVRYVEQLRRYHELFTRERVLVLIYDDFHADNEATVRRVLRFLEVDDTVPIAVREANPTVGVRSLRLHDLVRSVTFGSGPVASVVKPAVKAIAPRAVRRRALSATRRRFLFGEPPPADEELMLELRRRFKGEVFALSEYLGRDLVSLWGYDSIG